MIGVEYTCPLGSKCEEVRDGKLLRCKWYTQLQGRHPQTGAEIDSWECAITWLPILTIEMSRTNRGQTAALESFRNAMIKGQTQFNRLISEAREEARGLLDDHRG
jgi:hypothetical protein